MKKENRSTPYLYWKVLVLSVRYFLLHLCTQTTLYLEALVVRLKSDVELSTWLQWEPVWDLLLPPSTFQE
jgi:hypothetical protein